MSETFPRRPPAVRCPPSTSALRDLTGNAPLRQCAQAAMSVADAVQSIPHRGAQILGAACAALLLAEASGIRPDELFGMARNCMNHADGRRPEFAAVSDYIHNEVFPR